MSGPYLREPRFSEWVCGAAPLPEGKIKLQEGWRDPMKVELDMKSILTRILDTREKAIHDALVRLGWTPPRSQG
jgi:hypothetical protein